MIILLVDYPGLHFFFQHFECIMPFLFCPPKFLQKKQLITICRLLLYMTLFFSDAFKHLLICNFCHFGYVMSWFGFIMFGTLFFLYLDLCFLFQVWELFSYNFTKCIFYPFLSLFFLNPYS